MNYTQKISQYIEQGLVTPDKHPALYDYQFQLHLANAPWQEWLSAPGYFEVTEEYISTIKQWIMSTSNNVLSNLTRFEYSDVTVGTTQSFDEAYLRYCNRQLRVFSNEYGYHKRSVNCKFLDADGVYVPLDINDWVIVSLPFSGNGYISDMYSILLKDAEEKNVPVLIDCAWFGTCAGVDINLLSPSIQEVTFSLSKGIGLGNMRTGIRFSNYTTGYIRQQNEYTHLVKSNMQLGIWQMNKFSPDYISNKYQKAYTAMCVELGMKPTKCMHVAFYNNKLLGVRNLVKLYYKLTK